MNRHIYTVGHSNHPTERFLALLKGQGVTALCDVRSRPYSLSNPQFNEKNLKKDLADAGIKYVFLGAELGARSQDPDCYDHDKTRAVVNYEKLAETDLFKKGLDRIVHGCQTYTVALMCAEKDPLECHRTILIAPHLERLGLKVTHILPDGTTENHEDAMKRLVESMGIGSDMLSPIRDAVADAYHMQAKRIAYSKPAQNAGSKDQQE